MFQIIPAMDILDGQVVRLHQGNYQRKKVFHNCPVELSRDLHRRGATYIHIIDLLGAKLGKPCIKEIVKEILKLGIKIQLGGGIRSKSQIYEYLNLSVDRIILSTSFLQDPHSFTANLGDIPKDRLVISCDTDGKSIYCKGWLETSAIDLAHCLGLVTELGYPRIILTDVKRDGTGHGIRSHLFKSIKSLHPKIEIMAAGGVHSIADIIKLEEIGLSGCITGRQFYECEVFKKYVLTH